MRETTFKGNMHNFKFELLHITEKIIFDYFAQERYPRI